ncbi:hypothetical protein K1T71_008925 [Dendrolimus kikuchii]|uniref:Uncharacterized protein n=1 Tax=Dendrolimus kikuchii TaxID=765133 RepID=A0ACC1CVY9_9NEOP|nr:hypothetical protein K1T71_008925 [Dendrolimus kikuchii]
MIISPPLRRRRQDTALHSLQVCSTWDEQRRDLVVAIGVDLSLPAVVKAMMGSTDAWNAAASFCETVMSAKEAAEWEREQTATLRFHQSRRRRRRVVDDDFQPL